MQREMYRESRSEYRGRPSRYEDDDRYERGRDGRGGYAENVGQGGYFGDYEGHADIGRRGGQIRHERAMRAPRDEYGRSEDVGQGGYFGDYEGHSEIGRRGGQIRHERAMRAPRDEYGHAENVGQGGYFGDYEGHSEIGRRGGEIRHERAMRARHDLDEPDERGRGDGRRYDGRSGRGRYD